MNRTPNAASLSRSSRFDALEVALELIRALRPVIAKIRRRSRKDADQIHDASTSIARNLGEGSRRLGRDRVQSWSVASGSTGEVKDALRTCLAAGFIDDADLTEVWPLLDRECAMTWNMTH
jgi:four helix bundle protein